MNNKVSVIVPAYNSEKTIKRCLTSILSQSYSNLDVIVINDGSSDGTEQIVKVISESDERVRLFSISNSGVSHARNYGLDHAEGEFITFVDSDDYIDKEMYEDLMSLILRYKVKISHCSYKNVDEYGCVVSEVGNSGKIVKQSHDEAIESLVTGKLFAGGLCNKVFAKELFNSIRLDESIKYNEDVLMNYHLFDKVDYSAYIDKAYYNYVSTAKSSTHTANALNFYNDIVYVARKMLILSEGKPYHQACKVRLANNTLNLYAEFARQKVNHIQKKKLLKEIRIYKSQGLYVELRLKIKYFLVVYFPQLYWLFYSTIYDKIRRKKLDPEQ